MPQIFSRRSNTLATASLVGLVLLIGVVVIGGYAIVRSPYITQVAVAPEQLVPFSHAHHVGDVGIDCRYCHASAEHSSFAGMPSTETCMHCHSQIWSDAEMLRTVRESFQAETPIAWTRVHDLPDFTYFDHSIHVNKGVGCVTCHGDINQMPLTRKAHSLQMQWCLDCHRHPENFIRPPGQVFSVTWEPPDNQEALAAIIVQQQNIQPRTDCYTCHR